MMTSLNEQLMMVITSLWTIDDSDNFNNEQLMIVAASLWIIDDGYLTPLWTINYIVM